MVKLKQQLKKKKAFTLIELLAVIFVMGIISVIVIPTMNRLTTQSKEEMYQVQLDNIITGAKNWGSKNPDILPEKDGEIITVTLGQLKVTGFAEKEIKNPKTKRLFPDDMEITITRKTNNYEYKIVEGTGGKNTEVNWEAPIIIINGLANETVEINTEYVDKGVTIYTPDGEKIEEFEETIRLNYEVVDKVDTSELVQYKITYKTTYKDVVATAIRTVTVVDTIPPVLSIPGNVEIEDLELKDFDFMEGVSAIDNSLEEITVRIVGEVSVVPGKYLLKYVAEDSSGNKTEKPRFITVIDSGYTEIKMLGSNPITINVGTTYKDAGVTAIDTKEGDLTGKVITTGVVNVNVPGTYLINYSVTNQKGDTVTATRVVNVVDNVPPTVSFSPNGNSTYAKTRTTKVTVTDSHSNVDSKSLKYLWTNSTSAPQESSFNLTFSNGSNISTPNGLNGGYYLWILAKDTAGNRVITRSNVFRLDNTPPVITINGSSNITINRGSSYTDAGAKATDNYDGNVSVTTSGSVNTNTIGTYRITYTAVDSSGNSASATRVVNVVDGTAPVITILGDNPHILILGTPYNDAGATAVDDVDGNVTSKIVRTGSVNINVKGNYTITYKVSDKAGNTATATRTVRVIDDQPPKVSFGTNGNSTYRQSHSTKVTVTDADGEVTGRFYQWTTSTSAPSSSSFTQTFSNNQTISTPSGVTGGYYLWVKATDDGNNVVITRSNVFRLDNTKPIVTLNGSSSMSISLGGTYSEPGATASDNIDGNITSKIVRTGSVNTRQSGTYYINYSVTDNAGNVSTTVRRTVRVNSITEYRYRESYESCSTCYETCSETQSADVSYSCPSGYSGGGSSSTCRKTETQSANVSYSCPSGYTGGGSSSTCRKTETQNASRSYSCPSGWSRSGSTCSKTTTTTGSASYSCPSGWSRSGSTCRRSYSCYPYDCNCRDYWGSWSSWSTTPVTPYSWRQVETREKTSL